MDEPHDHVEERFERFYRDNFTQTARLVRLLTNRPDVADDLAQDAFVRVYRHAQNTDRPIDNPAALRLVASGFRRILQERPCVECDQVIAAGSRAVYCGAACRSAAYRRRVRHSSVETDITMIMGDVAKGAQRAGGINATPYRGAPAWV